MVTLTEYVPIRGTSTDQKGAPVDAILRRLRSLTTEHRTLAEQRSMSFFGAWQALDDDPVLLCECGDDDCPHAH